MPGGGTYWDLGLGSQGKLSVRLMYYELGRAGKAKTKSKSKVQATYERRAFLLFGGEEWTWTSTPFFEVLGWSGGKE